MTAPASFIFEITPDDAESLERAATALRVFNPETTDATVALVNGKGNTVTLTFPAGLTIEHIGVTAVKETGTTAGLELHGYA